MHYSLRTLIITTFLLIFGVGIINGQEDESIIIPYVTSDDDFLTMQALNSLAQVTTYFEDWWDIEVLFEQIESLTLYNSIPIYLNFYDESVVQVVVNNTDIESVSPILHAEYSNLALNLDCGDCLNFSRDHIVEELSGIISYAMGYYDTSEYLLERVFNRSAFVKYNLAFLLGNMSLVNGDSEAALHYYQFIQTTEPAPNINMAWIYFRSNNSETTFGILNNLYDLGLSYSDPTYLVKILAARSQFYGLDFDYDSAIADINEALAIAEGNELDNTTLAELYTIRGEIIFLIYEWDRVEANFDMAIEIDPSYAPAYFQRGVLFYTMARRDDALTNFETYLELDEDGIYAEQAQSYIESIQIELDALDG